MKAISAVAIALASTLGGWCTSAQAQPITNDHSANYYLPGCRDFALQRFGDNPFLQGECVGILEGLSATASNLDPFFMVSRSCAPDNATLAQMAAVIVWWFDQRPERLHEDFRALALHALHDAWPCLKDK
jgi:Rap1a immunity proteins